MLPRVIARLRLIALIALEVAAIPLLRGSGAGPADAIDWAHLGRWLDATAPEDAVTAVVRVVGLALATWLLASTVLYTLARLTRLTVLVGGVRWATLPVVRKVVDGAVAASVFGSAALGAHPAGAQATRPPIVVELGSTSTSAPAHRYVPTAAGDPLDTTTTAPTSTSQTSIAPATARAAPASRADTPQVAAPAAGLAAAPAPVAGPSARVHAVVQGDNLWTIAAADLARQTGRQHDDLSVGEVAAHWVKVVAANRDRLASGNPSLIFPGETIVCPPAG